MIDVQEIELDGKTTGSVTIPLSNINPPLATISSSDSVQGYINNTLENNQIQPNPLELTEKQLQQRSIILNDKLLLNCIFNFVEVNALKPLCLVSRVWNKVAKHVMFSIVNLKFGNVVPSNSKDAKKWAQLNVEAMELLYPYRYNIDTLFIKSPIYSFTWMRILQFRNLTTLNVGPMLFMEGPAMYILDLKNYFPNLVNYSVSHPTDYEIFMNAYPTPQLIHCTGLNSLELNWLAPIWSPYIKYNIKKNPTLERLSLNRLCLTFSLIREFGAALNNLKSLEIDILSSSSRQGNTLPSSSDAFNSAHSVPDIALVTPQSSNSNFTLRWEDCTNIDTCLAVLLAQNPNLDTFKFRYSMQVGAMLTSLYLIEPLKKKSLSLSFVRFHPDFIKTVFKHCTELTHVELEDCNGASDSVIEALVTHCPNLQSLTLKDSGMFTCKLSHTSLHHIRNHCTSLQNLSLIFPISNYDQLMLPWKCDKSLINIKLFEAPHNYKYLKGLEQFDQLKRISFKTGAPSPVYLERVQGILPNLKVVYFD